MIKIIDKRGTGKTSRLLLVAKENDGIVVCRNENALRQKAIRYGITGVTFLSYGDYIDQVVDGVGEEMDKNKPIYIDEMSSFMKFFDEHFQGYSDNLEV